VAWRRRREQAPRRGTPADAVVVGLGNPGEEYAGSRHNVGAAAVELLAGRHGGQLRKGKERARSCEVHIGERRVALAVPLTYMNDAGMAVRPLVRRYGVTPDQLVVVHDELDLPVAGLQVKSGGGLAGHNGLRSIVAHLHDDAFQRVRIGVGKPATKERGADHVLHPFGKRERDEIAVMLEEAADAVETIVTEGVEAAMNRYNTRRERTNG
jgi:PTH1 family peptidyl-tRNA hydrolase